MGTNCTPHIADLFLYCYEWFYVKPPEIQTVWPHRQVQWYLEDIFTIDNPEFAVHIPEIYPRELQLNKANNSDKETSFLDLNITVIGSNIPTSVNDKRDDFGFILTYSSGWVVMFRDSHHALVIFHSYIALVVRLARCCTSVFYFHSKKIFKSLQNYWLGDTDVISFGKSLESSLGHTLNFCPNLVQYRFKNMYPKEPLIRFSTTMLSTN